MSDYSAILKKYVINNGTYVDKKMEPLATKEDLNNFKTTWMFPGLKVTVIADEDGEMRDYQCKMVDGEKIWVPVNVVSEEKLDEAIAAMEEIHNDIVEGYQKADAKIEFDYKKADEEFDERVSAFESIFIVQGNDIEK